MALKSSYTSEERGAEIEEALDSLDKLVDRLKVLYEQYFMGIQKQAPSHLHADAERRLREVAQMQIRNTALRYRFATIQQKYGSYNTYWKRSLREIEAGRYVRNLSKLRRQAMQSGENIPPEILAAMPKRMRDAVERDRALAVADAQRRKLSTGGPEADEPEPDTEPTAARVVAPPPPRRGAKVTTDPFAHASDDDLASALSGLADEALAAIEATTPRPVTPSPRAAPPSPRAAPPPRVAPPPPISRTSPPGPPVAAVPRTAPPVVAAAPRTAPPVVAAAPRTAPPVVAAAPRTAPPAAAAPPRARPAPPPGMTESETRALYAKYVKAREVVGDRSEGLSYEKLVRTLSTQAPKILEQHKATGVEFNVVIRDNKVVLKAKPR